MRIVFLFPLMMIAAGTQAAPAPVFKPSKAPKTPYEVMLAELRKTGKVGGTAFTTGRPWSMTAVPGEGRRLKSVVLSFISDDEKRVCVIATTDETGVRVGESDTGGLTLEFENTFLRPDDPQCHRYSFKRVTFEYIPLRSP